MQNGSRSRPWVAACLAILTPPLGHLYVGLRSRAAWIFLGWIVAGQLALASLLFLSGINSILIWMGLLIFALVYMARDAFVQAKRHNDHRSAFLRWSELLVVGVLYWALLGPALRQNFARTWQVSTGNMNPTLLEGDRVVAATYGLESLERGDVIVHRWRDREGFYISRVVALPGDTVSMENWTLAVNGEAQTEPYVLVSDSTSESHPMMDWQRTYFVPTPFPTDYAPTSRDWGPIDVPEGAYLVLGDHRNLSFDSRYQGFVLGDGIAGKVRRIYLSTDPVSGEPRYGRMGAAVH